MELRHIPLGELQIAAINMRHGRRAPDIADILPSVRARGILQPLLVRANGEGYEIVAGRRRYFCAKTIAEEAGDIAPLPCAVMEAGDDAAALEASLIENVARLDPDPMSEYETFVRLTKEGRGTAEIAATFGLTETMVKQRLALGNLLAKIRDAYRDGAIDNETIRYLTLASKAQQKEWLALFEDEAQSAPFGRQLKQWLFGGQSISTKVALFPLADYPGQIVADLFGEDGYFADADLFWQKQNEAIAAKRDALLAAGWSEVVVLETGRRFFEWEHEKTPKRKGGKVFVTVSQQGEVEFHEGWLSRQEARRGHRQDGAEEERRPAKPARPEVTSALQTYVDLHRHAAVRAVLLDHPGVALRLMLSHAIVGSRLWHVHPEPQVAKTEAVAASLAASKGELAFNARRADILALLGLSEERDTVTIANGDDYAATALFVRLLSLSDDEVLRVLAVVMGETLAAGSALVEAVGVYLKIDMTSLWQPDDAFFELLRDKPVLNAMLAEVAGKAVADANIAEKTKTQKHIIRDCLSGSNGRVRVENWLPGWMMFPVHSYTERGGFATADEWARVRDLFPSA
jgi:ParB family chromosome partitioning protein